MEKHKVKQVKK